MTEYLVKTLGPLPQGDANGLTHYGQALDKDRLTLRFAVVVFDCANVEEKTAEETSIIKPRTRRVELVTDPGDAPVLADLVRRAWERRNGLEMLPLGLENDFRAAMDALDPDAIAREVAAEREERAQAAVDEHMVDREVARLERDLAEPDRAATMAPDEKCPSCDWPVGTDSGEECKLPEMHLGLPDGGGQ
jgi:hypothetical protein